MPHDNIPLPELPDELLERTLELRDLLGLVQTRTSVPTYTPKKFIQQVVVVVTGGNASLYVYDISNNQWRAATLGT